MVFIAYVLTLVWLMVAMKLAVSLGIEERGELTRCIDSISIAHFDSRWSYPTRLRAICC